MTLRDVVKALNLEIATGKDLMDRPVNGGYASDVLSDVLTHSGPGDLWITVQVHPNVSAVATAKGLSAVIISNGRDPEDETLRKAEKKKIPILKTRWSTYRVAGMLYGLGIE